MKKFLVSIITLFAIIFLVSINESKAEALPEPLDASAKFDLTKNGPQEKDIYDESGDYVGTLGIEPVQNKESGMTTMGTQPIKKGKSTFKIFWTTGVINLRYYINVTRPDTSISYSKITKAYDEWCLVSPPFTVSSDTLSILNAQEASKKPAQARYRVKYGVLGQGSINYDLNAKVSLNYLITGVSSF
ncbi:DUF5626 family protein (plasmid) [Peribacillus sp. RS7]|uniref:DUF5626 family protein n=1 Tax=Peribacillus sp. RS7 TaxID=3242679 RepID=UPI0035C22375